MLPRSTDDEPQQVAVLVNAQMRCIATLAGRTVRVSWQDGTKRVNGEPREYDDENQAKREWKKAIAAAQAKGYVLQDHPGTRDHRRDELVRAVSGVGEIRESELVLKHGRATAPMFAPALQSAVKNPALKDLKSLTVELASPHDADAVVDALAANPLPDGLGGLVLCRFDGREVKRRDFVATALDLRPLEAQLCARKTVVAQAGWVTLPQLSAPDLMELRVRVAGLSRAAIFALGAAELPSLDTLELWVGAPENGAECTATDLLRLLGDSRWPELRELRLHGLTFSDALIEPLLALPIVERLEVLDLSYGSLTDASAEALASHRDRLESLELALDGNEFSAAAVDRLDDAGVHTYRQRVPGSKAGVERYLPLGHHDDQLSSGSEADLDDPDETD